MLHDLATRQDIEGDDVGPFAEVLVAVYHDFALALLL